MPNPTSVFTTTQLLAAVKQLTPATSFLSKRYFPTDAGSIFSTEYVLVEYKDGTLSIAPHVTPGNTSLNLARPGYDAWSYKPPMAKVRRVLTIDDLQQKGFGEALYSNLTPQQRAAQYTAEDLAEMDERLVRTEEMMCARVMQDNALTVDVYADNLEDKQTETMNFFTGRNNAVYTPSNGWDNGGADILGDLNIMAQMLIQTGQPAVDLVVGAAVASAIVNNNQIAGMLDNRRYEMGGIAPDELGDGAYLLGRLNAYGPTLNIIAYPMMYTDLQGNTRPYIDDNKVVMTYPGAGRMLYGAITQIDEEGGEPVTHAERRVPKFIGDVRTDVREYRLASRPLPIVVQKDCFISATVLTNGSEME